MAEERNLIRPPFDEEGNVVWTTEEKPITKKALRWWVWLIPIGLICVIVTAIVIYRAANHMSPEELCRFAVRDALSDTVGVTEPVLKAMNATGLMSILKAEQKSVSMYVRMDDTSMTAADYGLDSLLGDRNLSDFSGAGVMLRSQFGKEGTAFDFRGAFSVLSLSLLSGYRSGSTLLLTSPKLISEVISIDTSTLSEQWKDLEIRKLLPDNAQTKVTELIETGLQWKTRLTPIAQELRAVLAAFSGGTDGFANRLLDEMTYEQVMDADGKEMTERIVVGSEKTPCYVYRMTISEERLYDLAESAAVARKGEDGRAKLRDLWHFSDGYRGETDIFLYVTKAGQLAMLTTEISGTLGAKPVSFTLTVHCSGADNPQDKTDLQFDVKYGDDLYALRIVKQSNDTRSYAKTRLDATVSVNGTVYGLNGAVTYEKGDDTMQLEANLVDEGNTVGTMKFTADCSVGEEYSIKLRNWTFTNRFNGKDGKLYGEFKANAEDKEPEPPKGTRYELSTMTEQQAREIFEEGKSQAEWYLKTLGSLVN